MTTFLNFDFNHPFDDARLAELRLLSFAAQHGQLATSGMPEGPWRDLMLAAVMDETLTAFSYALAPSSLAHHSIRSQSLVTSRGIVGESGLERAMVIAKVQALGRLFESGTSTLYMTHRGRVRLSELKQALRSGREREPFGILWDGRYAAVDLEIMLLDASAHSPVSVVYMDMNGLKQLNDTLGHDAGDRGLRAYFEAVSSALADSGQAYRLGGDEVLALIPGRDRESASRIVETACRLLMNEHLELHEKPIKLSIAAGVVDVVDPNSAAEDVRARADAEQYRAKNESKKTAPRQSVIAVQGENDLRVLPLTT